MCLEESIGPYVTYLHSHVIEYLKHQKCPSVVYRKIWSYVPHTVVPEMYNLKEELLKKHIVIGFVLSEQLLATGIPDPRYRMKRRVKAGNTLHRLYRDFGSYKNIIFLIKKMETNDTFKRDIFDTPIEERIIKLGPYVHWRKNLLHTGIL